MIFLAPSPLRIKKTMASLLYAHSWMACAGTSGRTVVQISLVRCRIFFPFVREGALWANQPTDTVAQLALFEQAFPPVHGGLDDEGLFWKISGIDEKIHTEKGPLTHLFA